MARLERAAIELTRVEMHLFAAAARRQFGGLLGGSAGDALVADANQRMSAQGIRRPERFAAMLGPCSP